MGWLLLYNKAYRLFLFRCCSRVKIKRTQVIRALVAALQTADLDLTDADSEDDPAVRLQSALS